MCRGHDPFFQASRRYLAYQFTIKVPPFAILGKKKHFQPCFWPKFQLSRRKISEFLLPRPFIFQGKPAPLTLFWKPARHVPTKKVECPLGFNTCISEIGTQINEITQMELSRHCLFWIVLLFWGYYLFFGNSTFGHMSPKVWFNRA